MKKYLVVAYYYFCQIEDPNQEVLSHKNFFKDKDAKGRIYISKEGFNGQLSACAEDAKSYMRWLEGRFVNIVFKIQEDKEHSFCKMTIKHREQLVAFDRTVDLSKQGEHIAPEAWQKMLEKKDEDTIVLDVRNDYEWDVGHFEQAKRFPYSSFREFPKYTKELKKQTDPKKTKVMMYCTGGIRCEYYSAYLKEEGFEKIYQLEGGVINYGQKVGSKYWKGDLFVFDDRLTIPISSEHSETIGTCLFCKEKTSTYYNCANMDCNELFLSCLRCVKTHNGCCSDTCTKGRVRSFDASSKPKPFRKLPFSEKKGFTSKE